MERSARLHQSGFAPENLITLAHFSVSVAMNLAKSEDEPGNTAAPRSANRAFNLGSTRPALISLLSLSTISADVRQCPAARSPRSQARSRLRSGRLAIPPNAL